MKYEFKQGEVIAIKNAKAADAQTIGEALEAIRVARGGELTPQNVVREPESPQHPLHGFFEWDNTKAAVQFRLDQARGIIRLVRVADTDAEEAPRAFISIGSDKGTSYRSFGEVKASADLTDAVLAAAQRELEAFERRYRSLKEVLEPVGKAKSIVIAARAARRDRYESRASA